MATKKAIQLQKILLAVELISKTKYELIRGIDDIENDSDDCMFSASIMDGCLVKLLKNFGMSSDDYYKLLKKEAPNLAIEFRDNFGTTLNLSQEEA